MATEPGHELAGPAAAHEVLRALAARRRTGSQPGARDDGLRIALVIEGGAMRGVVSAGRPSPWPLLAGPPVEFASGRFYDAGVSESIPYRTALTQGARGVLDPSRRQLTRGRPPGH